MDSFFFAQPAKQAIAIPVVTMIAVKAIAIVFFIFCALLDWLCVFV
jgi:hypothetical protein